MRKTYYKDPNTGFNLSPFDSSLNEPVKSPLPDEWRQDDDFEDEGAPDDDDDELFI